MNRPVRDRVRAKALATFRVMPVSVQQRVLHTLHRHPAWEQGRPPIAPPSPPGMATGAPDFVGVGMSKCGTSWWFSLIMAHPDVHVEHDKELLFFNPPFFHHFNSGRCTQAEIETYRDWFPRPPGTITGEWTPHYVFRYQLPPILRSVAPRAKILVLVRDPVERYHSDISRAMPKSTLRSVRLRSLANGFYASVLRPWEAAYDPDQILVLQYEQCVRAPAEMLTETFRFLGIDDTFRPASLRSPVNETRSKRALDAGVTGVLTSVYEREVLELTARYPHIDLGLWPHFAHLTGRPTAPLPSD